MQNGSWGVTQISLYLHSLSKDLLIQHLFWEILTLQQIYWLICTALIWPSPFHGRPENTSYHHENTPYKGRSRTWAPVCLPFFSSLKKKGTCFVNLHCIYANTFDFSSSVYNYMYIIHYSSNKNIQYVWRGIKANLRSKNSSAPGHRPPSRFEIPGSAPAILPYTTQASQALLHERQLFQEMTTK